MSKNENLIQFRLNDSQIIRLGKEKSVKSKEIVEKYLAGELVERQNSTKPAHLPIESLRPPWICADPDHKEDGRIIEMMDAGSFERHLNQRHSGAAARLLLFTQKYRLWATADFDKLMDALEEQEKQKQTTQDILEATSRLEQIDFDGVIRQARVYGKHDKQFAADLD